MAKVSHLKDTQGPSGWASKQIYLMAGLCLLVGLIVGYLLPGSTAAKSSKPVAASATANAATGAHPVPTIEQMKQLADSKAAPLLAKLKAEPQNASLLAQIGAVYNAAHQFKTASEYYGKSLSIDPKNVATRIELASCLYYNGDSDAAISQLQQTLKYDPKNVNALFNLGMVKWKGKNDPKGAIAVWQELLRGNPNLDRKPIVEKMIAEAQAQIPAGK